MTALPTYHCDACKDRCLKWVLAHPNESREAMDAEYERIEAACQGDFDELVGERAREFIDELFKGAP